MFFASNVDSDFFAFELFYLMEIDVTYGKIRITMDN